MYCQLWRPEVKAGLGAFSLMTPGENVPCLLLASGVCGDLWHPGSPCVSLHGLSSGCVGPRSDFPFSLGRQSYWTRTHPNSTSF